MGSLPVQDVKRVCLVGGGPGAVAAAKCVENARNVARYT